MFNSFRNHCQFYGEMFPRPICSRRRKSEQEEARKGRRRVIVGA
jgi:hypothetical protein